MATYAIEGTCSLAASIEPDGRLHCEGEGFEDTSSYWSQEIDFYASFSFEVTAYSEEDARRKAQDEVDSSLFFDSDDFEWEIRDVEVTEVTRTSPELTPAEALGIVRGWDGRYRLADDEPEVAEALTVICDAYEALLLTASEAPFVPGEAPVSLDDKPEIPSW